MEIRGLTKRYATGETTVAALDGVDLTAESGSLVAIMGPSGSGKSTLLHLVGAMDAADDGEIDSRGSRRSRHSSRGEQVEYRRRIGFVFQRFHLLPALTALDNVLAPVLPYKAEFDKDARGRELLAAVGLAGRGASVAVRAFGRRAAAGRDRPRARERARYCCLPTSRPATSTRRQALRSSISLLSLREQRGMTVFIGTHDAVVASRCDRIVRLLDGRIVEDLEVPRRLEPETVLNRITRVEPT